MLDIRKIQEMRPKKVMGIKISEDGQEIVPVISDNELESFMQIILDRHQRPEELKELFRNIGALLNSFMTVSEASKSINDGEEFIFISRLGPLLMNKNDLENGFIISMQENNQCRGIEFNRDTKSIKIDVEILRREGKISEIVMYSLFGKGYSSNKEEILKELQAGC